MKKAFMTHLVCGYPSLKESEEILQTLSKYSNYIEVQFPFSDPIADGNLIAQANDTALKNSVTPDICFDFLERNIKKVDAHIIIMTYFNIVYHYGIEKFFQKSQDIGVYGFIIPDIPFDEIEAENLLNMAHKYNIHLIPVVSPWVSPERLEKLSQFPSEIVYAISKNMTTGSQLELWEIFQIYMQNLRKYFPGKIGVWFGIKTQKDIKEVLQFSDIAIIGSEIINKYEKDGVKGINELFWG